MVQRGEDRAQAAVERSVEFQYRDVFPGVQRVVAARVTMGASAVAAVSLVAVSISTALSYAPKTLQEREAARKIAEQVLGKQGISISVPLPANPGFDWVGTVTPAIFALLLIGLIVFLHTSRADRA